MRIGGEGRVVKTVRDGRKRTEGLKGWEGRG
jgi:hypothetical protein